MIWTIFKKEYHEHILSFRFFFSTVLCIGLIVVSMVVLRNSTADLKRDFDVELASPDRKGNKSLRSLDVLVTIPPSPLQMFAWGLAGSEVKSTVVEPDLIVPFAQTRAFDTDLIRHLLPTMDLVFITAYVLSLVAFLFTYDALCGERERRTLALVLSNAVPRDQLLLGKWLGGYSILCTVFLIACLMGSATVLFSPRVALSAGEWVAAVLIVGACLLFLALMFSLGLLVSTLCRRSSTAIHLLFLIWIVFVFAVPNGSPFLADQVYPVPPASDVERRIMEAAGQIWEEHRQEDNKIRARDYEEWKRTALERRAKARRRQNEAFARIWGDQERKMYNQIEVMKYISRLSPVSSLIYACVNLADTGMAREKAIKRRLHRYMEELRRYQEEKMEEWRQSNPPNIFNTDWDVSDMPDPVFPLSTVSERVQAALLDLALLALFTIVLFMAAHLSFLRRDVT